MSEKVVFNDLVNPDIELLKEVGYYQACNGKDYIRYTWIRHVPSDSVKLNIRRWWTGRDGVLRPSQFPEKGIPDGDFENFAKMVTLAKKSRPSG